MVQPSNLADVVQEFIDHLVLEPEKKFFLEQNDPGESFVSLSVRFWYHYGPSCGPYSNYHHDCHLHILSSSSLSFLFGILLSPLLYVLGYLITQEEPTIENRSMIQS